MPLRPFSSASDTISLDDDVTLSRVTNEQLVCWGTALARDLALQRPLAEHHADYCNQHLPADFAMTVRSRCPHGQPIAEIRVTQELHRLVTALRLMRKARDPQCMFRITFPVAFHPVGLGPQVGLEALPPPQDPRGPLVVEPGEVEQLRQLWSQLKASGELAIALRRFNDVHARDNPEDKLIDMAILLESTLLKGDKEELKHRLRLRGARLLSRVRCPSDTFKFLGRLYDVRSKVVHGEAQDIASARSDKKSLVPEGAGAFVAEAQDICTDVLLSLLGLPTGESVEDCLKRLDREAIEGVPPGSVSTDVA